jgi:hypothetical protein
MVIDQETFGAMTPKKALEIIGRYDKSGVEAAALGNPESDLAEKEA